ncbi:MAG: hypothetical protein AABW41_03015 [Nanoarchaeota archaeon]
MGKLDKSLSSLDQLVFKIIKANHETKEDANLVMSVLKEMDVVSLEQQFCSEFLAQSIERYFFYKYHDYKLDESLMKFEKDWKNPNTWGYTSDFNLSLWDYLIANRIPVIILERLPDYRTNQTMTSMKTPFFYIGAAPPHHIKKLKELNLYGLFIDERKIFEGDLDYLCKNIYENVLLNHDKNVVARDKTMGLNSRKISRRIFSLYPSLRQKENVNYGIIVGGLHNPEKYISSQGFNTEIINNPDLRIKDFSDKMSLCLIQGKGYDDVKNILTTRALLVAIYPFMSTEAKNSIWEIECALSERVTYGEIKNLFNQVASAPRHPSGITLSKEQHALLIGYADKLIHR